MGPRTGCAQSMEQIHYVKKYPIVVFRCVLLTVSVDTKHFLVSSTPLSKSRTCLQCNLYICFLTFVDVVYVGGLK